MTGKKASADLGAPHGADLKSLRARARKNLGKIPDRWGEYPCIVAEEGEFARIISKFGKTGASVQVDLDILRDGTGNVFVDVKLSAEGGNESFLIDAAKEEWFFEALAGSAVLGIYPRNQDGRVFAVQLPKHRAAEDALEKIRAGLAK